MVELANAYYLANNIAVVVKVPTEWLPIRGHDGRVVSAKVERRSSVDFIGHVGGRPVAFDVKECSGGRWSLGQLKEHQVTFLRNWRACGGLAFILLHSVPGDSWHVLWLDEYERLAGECRGLRQAEIAALPKCGSTAGCLVDWVEVAASGGNDMSMT